MKSHHFAFSCFASIHFLWPSSFTTLSLFLKPTLHLALSFFFLLLPSFRGATETVTRTENIPKDVIEHASLSLLDLSPGLYRDMWDIYRAQTVVQMMGVQLGRLTVIT